ncbi:transmembrane protein, putative [Medicago truncatula]|uniref:Transmembrane protein, putative n=1 Tax=Medicago truncatula TaxID=3880 RepID=A0A072V6P4_MEDTR|nr:transmembrane protein, putative [Medicago truncatula]
MKNEDSHSSIVPEVEKEHATLSISLEGEDQTIPSSESHGKINKEVMGGGWFMCGGGLVGGGGFMCGGEGGDKRIDGRKRGRLSKVSNPPWLGRSWVKRIGTRENGTEDVYYIHIHVPRLKCRTKREVENYDKYGIRPRRNFN